MNWVSSTKTTLSKILEAWSIESVSVGTTIEKIGGLEMAICGQAAASDSSVSRRNQGFQHLQLAVDSHRPIATMNGTANFSYSPVIGLVHIS